jgi:RNA polymerase sigma-70 factor (ECF subfamily)
MPRKKATLNLDEFVTLLTSHQGIIRGYIRTILPNSAEVPDVLQETNIILWEKKDQFEPGTNFKAWALTIARFRALNARKKSLRSKEIVLDQAVIDVLDQSKPDDSTIYFDDQQVALEQCLGGLSENNRELIHYRYSSGKSIAEYSKITGRSRASLRVSLMRVRETLRHCVKQRMEGAV